ncbi:MAG: carboxypeptidase regulatory-like domain-containing protein, partial [Acidobacteriia bacterium]|nr:carboxypeptidase regulatory-like domain-containing protein [Terriglobia bacterium]
MKLRIWVSLLLITFALSAQEFRATISGLVSDPTGAPVANAKVSVRSIERDVVYEAQTGDTGRYLTRFLPPGKYTLSVEREGFKKAVREGLELSAADRINIDLQLQLGAVAESVTITSDIPLLATETASRASTIEQRYVENIPSSGRNLYQLLFSQPGVIKTSRYWGSFELYAFGNINSISINGGRSGENETLIDGITSV